MTVRTRFAPSPTGIPHVGNLRSALFAWLFARHHQGTFILRIEDTDQNRYDDRAEQAIIDSMAWLGLDYDEGVGVGGPHDPYRQSERKPLYIEKARWLVERGFAYYCYCSSERLDGVRKAQQARKEPPGYDNNCRDKGFGPAEPAGLYEGATDRPVVRFKMPLAGTTTVQDFIRGEVTWENRLLDDFVILKGDQFPTYHLASVVDDHEMEVTHVLRADEWLASTPRHWRLYEAFGYERPVFAHLPLILGPDKSKLSKRHGAVSVFEYRDQGFLPEAMVNFLALLGWSLDDKTEIMSRAELVAGFTLERVGASPAVFDLAKLEWLNGHYIRQMTPEQFTDAFLDYAQTTGYWAKKGVSTPPARERLLAIAPLIQERTKKLDEVWDQIDFFFAKDVPYPAIALWAGMGQKDAMKAVAANENRPLPEDAPEVRRWLEAAARGLRALTAWDHAHLEEAMRALAEETGAGNRKLFGVLRVAATGRTVSPPLFETMVILGKEETLTRVEKAVGIINA
jgi:glutamyl-tRNA synthetase